MNYAHGLTKEPILPLGSFHVEGVWEHAFHGFSILQNADGKIAGVESKHVVAEFQFDTLQGLGGREVYSANTYSTYCIITVMLIIIITNI